MCMRRKNVFSVVVQHTMELLVFTMVTHYKCSALGAKYGIHNTDTTQDASELMRLVPHSMVTGTRMMKLCTIWFYFLFSFNVCFRRSKILSWKYLRLRLKACRDKCVQGLQHLYIFLCEYHRDQNTLFSLGLLLTMWASHRSISNCMTVPLSWEMMSGSFNLISWPPLTINSDKFSP